MSGFGTSLPSISGFVGRFFRPSSATLALYARAAASSDSKNPMWIFLPFSSLD